MPEDHLRRGKRDYQRYSASEIRLLEDTFESDPYPTTEVKLWLAQQCNRPIGSINVWLENRRRKNKRLSRKRSSGEEDDIDANALDSFPVKKRLGSSSLSDVMESKFASFPMQASQSTLNSLGSKRAERLESVNHSTPICVSSNSSLVCDSFPSLPSIDLLTSQILPLSSKNESKKDGKKNGLSDLKEELDFGAFNPLYSLLAAATEELQRSVPPNGNVQIESMRESPKQTPTSSLSAPFSNHLQLVTISPQGSMNLCSQHLPTKSGMNHTMVYQPLLPPFQALLSSKASVPCTYFMPQNQPSSIADGSLKLGSPFVVATGTRNSNVSAPQNQSVQHPALPVRSKGSEEAKIPLPLSFPSIACSFPLAAGQTLPSLQLNNESFSHCFAQNSPHFFPSSLPRISYPGISKL